VIRYLSIKHTIFVLACTGLIFLSPMLTGQKATAREYRQEILTYPYSDPNPVPAMAVSPMVEPFYPYFVFDGYTKTGKPQNWKVISLENDYIKVTILPETGGKVWGAVEKSTGQEFVYQNHVMKFRAIGIRGPWTSGGIEHNFGLDLGHAPWTASPVDYITKENPDGSVSCTVGGLDLASGTEWRVNIVVPPDKAYFETRSMWYNPTPFHDAYLSWENAGFRASGNLQFAYPGSYYIGHDGSVNPWPIDKNGRDLSWYENNNFGTSKSYHVSGYFTGWFGGYWHDQDFGFAHYAPYSDAPGKKIWIWSLARDGSIWEDLLTDNDGQYIEAQSGVKFNQANRESGYNSPYNQLSIRPYYTDTKTEYWFPVVRTDGLNTASPAGAMNVINGNDSLRISASPNAAITDTLFIFADGKLVASEKVSLKPMQPFYQSFDLGQEKNKSLIVKLGHDLITWHSSASDLMTGRPTKTPEGISYNSASHLFRLAEDMNAMREYDAALENYLKCLKLDPSYNGALYRVAELYFRRTEYETALSYALKILENDTYDGGGNYIRGLICRSTGQLDLAEESFSVAARTMEYRSAAYAEIAGIRMQKKDFEGSREFCLKALDFNRLNILAREILVSALRKLEMKGEAEKEIAELLDTDPLCHYARFERYLLKPTEENLKSCKSLIRNELPHETYLELAIRYANLGMDSDAIKVLEVAPEYPTVYYWLAWLQRNSAPEKSEASLHKAVSISPVLIFPRRTETIPVLEWAISKNDSWKSKYYLGLIYWHLHNTDKAAVLFEQCGDLPDFAPFYIARGSFFRNVPGTYCHPCSDYETAVRLDPDQWRTWHYLVNFMQANGAFSAELTKAGEAFKKFPENPVTGTDYAKALLNSGKFAQCNLVLEKVSILPQEGAHEGHDIYDLANMSLAVTAAENGRYKEALKYIGKSRKWPENLGAGRPYDPDERFQDLLEAYCSTKTGEAKQADECYKRIIDFTLSNSLQEQEPLNLQIGIKVMNEHGLKARADSIMNRWKIVQDSVFSWSISSGSSAPHSKWLEAVNSGDKARAGELEKELAAIPSENRFRLILKSNKIIYRK
jgi:tetratricopeptide (TPR) repeat protein